MWDLPGPGLEPVSPELAGRFLTTAPPGKPASNFLINTLLWRISTTYKGRENSVMNPLPTFNNYELQQLLIYDLLCFMFTPFLPWHFLLSLIILKQIPHIMSFRP